MEVFLSPLDNRKYSYCIYPRDVEMVLWVQREKAKHNFFFFGKLSGSSRGGLRTSIYEKTRVHSRSAEGWSFLGQRCLPPGPRRGLLWDHLQRDQQRFQTVLVGYPRQDYGNRLYLETADFWYIYSGFKEISESEFLTEFYWYERMKS
jgi:hypothetical protein